MLYGPLENSSGFWPDELRNSAPLERANFARHMAIRRLKTLYRLVPRADMELERAIDEGLIDENEIVHVYDTLSHLLEQDPAGMRRIILYLPFEILPSIAFEPRTVRLEQSTARFANLYLTAWRRLLYVQDIRADFFDGDIIEPELQTQDPPRVVKAAHLIPMLVWRGLLTCMQVIDLAEQMRSNTLRRSIADTLHVLDDFDLLSPDEVTYLALSKHEMLSLAGLQIAQRHKQSQPAEHPSIKIIMPDALAGELDAIYAECTRIDAADYGDVTPMRRVWMVEVARRRALDTCAAAIARGMNICTDSLERALVEQRPSAKIVLMLAVQYTIESAARIDSPFAVSLYNQCRGMLRRLWDEGTPETTDTLTSMYCRLHSCGIVPIEQLCELGIAMPDLAGPYSKHAERMFAASPELTALPHAIEANTELMGMIYPVVLFCGSQVKGYGGSAADIDVAVLVRPEVNFETRSQLQALLKKTFAHEKIGGKVIEFWLEERGHILDVRDFPHMDPYLGTSVRAHILFGSAWRGDGGLVKELQTRLLVPYFHPTGKKLQGRDVRSIWLELMEREALLYRLLHKGYARFHSPQGGMNTEHSAAIDGDCAFWDSGYRRVATLLFLSHVFLAQIS